MKYTVVGGVAYVGTDMTLQLTKDQAAARAHLLEEVKGGWRPKSVVQFKAGEKLGIDISYDKLPRSLAAVLKPNAETNRNRKKTAEPAEPTPPSPPAV